MDWSKVAAFNMAGKEVVKVYDNVHEKTLWQKVAVQFLTLTADNDDNTISLASVADTDVEYKVDNGDWTAYSTATTLSGSTIKMRAVNKSVTPVTFKGTAVTGNFKVSGQLDSILDWKKLQANKASKITHAEECFRDMFNGNKNVTDATGLVLPTIDELPKNCYRAMFKFTSNLKKAFGQITAKVFGLASCYEMFYGSGLTGTFAIENVEKLGEYSCYSMFDASALNSISTNTFAKLQETTDLMTGACGYMVRATNVSSVMKTLPLKKIGKGMYQGMFISCQKLTTAPEIMATGYNVSTNAGYGMNGMFNNCQYLTSVQDAMYMTEAAGYDFQNMFKGCTKLAKGTKFTALKELRENASYVWNQCYSGCTSLTSNIDLPSALTYGCSDTSVTLHDIMSYMFYNCTSLVTPPEIPTFSLRTDSTLVQTNGTFQYMFANCTYLATVPSTMDAKLVKLYNNEMKSMFSGCTSLTSIPANYLKSYTQAETACVSTFESMFDGCTALTTIGNNMFGTWNCNANTSTFNRMFFGCKALTSLPDTFGTFTGTVSNSTFGGVFQGCIALTTANGIDTTGITLAQNAYSFHAMFYNCMALTETSVDLSNVTIKTNGDDGNYIFRMMFFGCKALKEIPFKFGVGLTLDGKNTLLFHQMYYNCSSITKVPEGLFADAMTRIEESGCEEMFYGCTSLYYVPQDLIAKVTHIGRSGCKSMFEGCTSLAEPVVINATSFANTAGDLEKMFYNTAIYMSETEDQEYATPWVAPANCTQMDDMFTSSKGKWASTPTAGKTYYLRQQALGLVSESKTDFTFTTTNEANLQTSTDNCTWTDYTTGSTVNSANGRLYVRGKDNDSLGKYGDTTHFFKITATVNDIDVSGVPTCLLKYNIIPSSVEYGYRAFMNLFYTQTALYDVAGWRINEGVINLEKYADEAKTQQFGTSLYQACFSGCTSITNAMKTFSIKAPAAYQGMFYNNSKLVSFGVKKVDQCEYTENEILYNQCWLMFRDCTSITKAIKMTITSMKQGGLAGLYYNCTGLVDASDITINVTDVPVYGMYNMFYSCTKLENVPTIVVVGINGTGGMQGVFYNCQRIVDASTITITGAVNFVNACYQMFLNCYKLQIAPTINVTNVGETALCQMFVNCRELIDASTITIAGTLQKQACQAMFQNAWLLRTPPVFGAITLSTNGYQFNNTFRTCLTLEDTPDMTQIQNYAIGCFQQMFYECSSLKEITWKFNSTAMYQNSCYGMFYYCNMLAKVPTDMLPATTLGTSCYQAMFQACVYLHTAPNLPATTVPQSAYQSMFQQCFNLLNLPTISATNLGQQACYNMFNDAACQVSSTQQGEFTNAWTLKATTVGTNALANMFANSKGTFTGTPSGTQTLYYKKTSYLMFKGISSQTITFKHNGSNAKLQTSTDNITYTDYTAGTVISGTQIWVRGKGNTQVSCNAGTGGTTYPFLVYNSDSSVTTGIRVYGNVNALLDYSDNTNTNLSMGVGCFRSLFNNTSNKITDIGYLCIPNDIVADYGYSNMFANCPITGVANQALPCINPGIYAYQYMYYNDSALTIYSWKAQIRAESVSNYMCTGLFYKCTNLSTVNNWNFNHARTVGVEAYSYMFAYTKVASIQEYFFANVEFIDFGTEASWAFQYMFQNSSLSTIAADTLRTCTGTNVFSQAFRNAKSLTTIQADAFRRVKGVTGRYTYSILFRDCNALTTVAADLKHITSLGEGQFAYMFYGCTALTKPIEMPETCTYGAAAVKQMYYGCTGIKMSATKTGDYTNEWKIAAGTTAGSGDTVSMYQMFVGTGGTFTDTPVIGTTYYYAAS